MLFTACKLGTFLETSPYFMHSETFCVNFIQHLEVSTSDKIRRYPCAQHKCPYTLLFSIHSHALLKELSNDRSTVYLIIRYNVVLF